MFLSMRSVLYVQISRPFFPSSLDQCSLSQRIIYQGREIHFAPVSQQAIHSSIMALGYVGNAAVTKECKDQSHRNHDQSLEGP
jgi:hypothetical protein